MKEKIIAEARSWIETKFQHQGRCKKTLDHNGGVDCFGLIIKISEQLAIKSIQGELLYQYDIINYSIPPKPTQLIEFFEQHLIKQNINEINVGNVLIFNFGHGPQHIALVGYNTIIHAYIQARKVVEQTLNDYWLKRIYSVYSFDLNLNN